MNTSPKNNDNNTDRRHNRYSFSSRKDMIAFFKTVLPKKDIQKIIRDMKKKFRPRVEDSRKEIKLQFLKKCEWELVRISKKRIINSEGLNKI